MVITEEARNSANPKFSVDTPASSALQISIRVFVHRFAPVEEGSKDKISMAMGEIFLSSHAYYTPRIRLLVSCDCMYTSSRLILRMISIYWGITIVALCRSMPSLIKPSFLVIEHRWAKKGVHLFLRYFAFNDSSYAKIGTSFPTFNDYKVQIMCYLSLRETQIKFKGKTNRHIRHIGLIEHRA